MDSQTSILDFFPLKNTWNDAGGKPAKLTIDDVLMIDGKKIVVCTNGHVVLCSSPDCINITKKDGLCKSHIPYLYKKKTCKYPACQKTARYGNRNSFIEFCSQHKSADMLDLHHISTKCSHDTCSVRGSFVTTLGDREKFCYTHKGPDMINKNKRIKCYFVGCNVIPTFNYWGLNPKFCKTHKTPSMVNVKDKKCISEDCEKLAYYGLEQNKPLFCSNHKEKNMFNVKRILCKVDNCNKRTSFFDKSLGKRFCSKHKTQDSVNINLPKCHVLECNSGANFGYKDGKRQSCYKHKLENMVSFSNKLCNNDSCNKRASFPKTSPYFCKTHYVL